MTIYMVVEGPVGEKSLYGKWIKFLNPSLSIVENIEEIQDNSVYIISGGGHPNYFNVIENAVSDIKNLKLFDRFVVAVDSEEFTFNQRKKEIEEHISSLNPNVDVKVIIQHYCLETWALGNRRIVKRNPQNAQIRKILKFYNILQLDPEELPCPPWEELTRAQFSAKLLRLVLNEKYKQLTYTKRNPKVLLHKKYYDRVSERYKEGKHIQSFGTFIKAFS